jgi:hypothetical protein
MKELLVGSDDVMIRAPARPDNNVLTAKSATRLAAATRSGMIRRSRAARGHPRYGVPRQRGCARGRIDWSRPPVPVRAQPVVAPLVRLGRRWWSRDELVGGRDG